MLVRIKDICGGINTTLSELGNQRTLLVHMVPSQSDRPAFTVSSTAEMMINLDMEELIKLDSHSRTIQDKAYRHQRQNKQDRVRLDQYPYGSQVEGCERLEGERS